MKHNLLAMPTVASMVAAFILTSCSSSEAGNSTQLQFGAQQPPTFSGKPIPGEFRFGIADMVEKVNPVVVSIQTFKIIKGAPRQYVDPFEFFFGPGFGGPRSPQPKEPPQEQPKQQGLGSGVIVSGDGYILTNNHVVEGADQIVVSLADKREFEAKVVGTDPQTDVAVIQLKKPVDKLPVAFLGASDALRVGEWVVAIGNPYGLSHTVTTGIVSAKGVHNRGITSYENFIQVDAAINPGNSGGALFDLEGKLVGINTAILSQSGGFQGIGFAIPIDLARSVMSDLIQFGKVSRGWLGVSIQDVGPDIAKAMKLDSAQGALINEVFDDTPAKKGGLQSGDIVVAIDGRPIKDGNMLRHTVAMLRPGSKAKFSVLRNGKSVSLEITVASRDDSGQIATGASGKDSDKGLGVEVEPLDDQTRQASGIGKDDGGVVVTKIQPESPADKAGLQQGDILLQINGRAVKGVSSLREILAQEAKADALLVLLKRGKSRLFVAVEK